MTAILTQIEIPNASLPGSVLAAAAEITPTQLAQRSNAVTPILFTAMRVWDAMATMVVGTPAADDLGLVTGTPGTHQPKLSTGDVKALGATSRKVAFELEVPANYDDGESFAVRFAAGMETTVADVSATIDLQAYKPSGTGTVGSDLVTTAAQSINSLTAADKDFVIDATGIDPGDKLICVLTIATNDAATATAVTACVYSALRRCDTRG